MAKVQSVMRSGIGPLYLVASEKALEGVFFKKQAVPMASASAARRAELKILARASRQLEEYFRGKRKKFDLPLRSEGTPFQKSVWRELGKIPYGRTSSYKEIARRVKNPRAVRAVGSANGKNPFCIIVPCHRVIAHDGTIGGYAGGLDIKNRLLALEGCPKIPA